MTTTEPTAAEYLARMDRSYQYRLRQQIEGMKDSRWRVRYQGKLDHIVRGARTEPGFEHLRADVIELAARKGGLL